MVREFHDAFDVVNREKSFLADEKMNKLRLSLLKEELDELTRALYFRDKVETLDALTDLQYVLDGAYLQLGFANLKDAAFREVHRSNMSKLGPDGRPIRRADGKVMKGPNYKAPDLHTILQLECEVVAPSTVWQYWKSWASTWTPSQLWFTFILVIIPCALALWAAFR